MEFNFTDHWPRMTETVDVEEQIGYFNSQPEWSWLWYLKLGISLTLSLFGGYALVGLLRDRCKKSEVVWKLTLIVFSAPVLVFVFFSFCAQCSLIERSIADSVSFGSVAGMLLKLVSRPTGDKVIKLIVQQVNGEKQDVWLSSSTSTVLDVRNQIAETLSIIPASRVYIESGKGKSVEDMSLPFFDLIDDAHKSTDFFGFITASCYVTITEPIHEEISHMDIEWKEKDRNKKFNPFKLLLDSRAKYGDPFMILGRSATSDDAKKFHVSAVDRFAGAAPGNAPLFIQLKIHAWSTIDVTGLGIEGEEGKIDDRSTGGQPKQNDWDNSSEVASSVNTTGTRKSRSIVNMLFRRKRPDESQLRGKPIRHGDAVVIECDGKFMSVTRGWWLAWSSSEPRFSGAFEIEIVERAPQNIKLLKEHITNLRKLGQLGNLNIHLPGTKHHSPKHSAHPPPVAEVAEKVVEQDPSLRPGDMFRLRSVKFPGYELGITSVKLQDEYYYLGLRKIGTSDAADDAWCMSTLFSVRSNTLGVNVINQ